MTDFELLRYTLATLAYRLRKCLDGAPDGFAEFTPGEGARSSIRLLHHITGATAWAVSHFAGEFENPKEVEWSEAIAQLESQLTELDQILIDQTAPKTLTLAQILQGPILDAMTHVGQLALYRRLAGSPIPGENFTKADIAPGKLSLS